MERNENTLADLRRRLIEARNSLRRTTMELELSEDTWRTAMGNRPLAIFRASRQAHDQRVRTLETHINDLRINQTRHRNEVENISTQLELIAAQQEYERRLAQRRPVVTTSITDSLRHGDDLFSLPRTRQTVASTRPNTNTYRTQTGYSTNSYVEPSMYFQSAWSEWSDTNEKRKNKKSPSPVSVTALNAKEKQAIVRKHFFKHREKGDIVMSKTTEAVLKSHGRYATTSDVLAEPAEPYYTPWYNDGRLKIQALPTSMVNMTIQTRTPSGDTPVEGAAITPIVGTEISIHRTEIYFLWNMAANYTERCYSANDMFVVEGNATLDDGTKVHRVSIKRTENIDKWRDLAVITMTQEAWDDASLAMRAISEAQSFYENNRVREVRKISLWKLVLVNIEKELLELGADPETNKDAIKKLQILEKRIGLSRAASDYKEDRHDLGVYFPSKEEAEYAMSLAYAEFAATYPKWVWVIGYLLTQMHQAYAAKELNTIVRGNYTRKDTGIIVAKPSIDYYESIKGAFEAFALEKGDESTPKKRVRTAVTAA